jgi:hypothetical protein
MRSFLAPVDTDAARRTDYRVTHSETHLVSPDYLDLDSSSPTNAVIHPASLNLRHRPLHACTALAATCVFPHSRFYSPMRFSLYITNYFLSIYTKKFWPEPRSPATVSFGYCTLQVICSLSGYHSLQYSPQARLFYHHILVLVLLIPPHKPSANTRVGLIDSSSRDRAQVGLDSAPNRIVSNTTDIHDVDPEYGPGPNEYDVLIAN